jgi:nucleotide-binding universal stress UspA family protein
MTLTDESAASIDLTQKPLEIKKILMAIDKSGYKEKVLSYSIALAKALQAELTAIHVIETTTTPPGLEDFEKEYESDLTKKSQDLLDEAGMLAKKSGLQIQKKLIKASSVPESIINYAKKEDMDFIVIGTMGMTGLEKYLMGSVASKIVTHAHCTVVAVR